VKQFQLQSVHETLQLEEQPEGLQGAKQDLQKGLQRLVSVFALVAQTLVCSVLGELGAFA
jgi:hypothetical protein